MITAIEIENFKGIRERTRIELSPVTLLFGPNSAGKSTLMHALQLAREIICRGNVDADRTESGLDLGGFEQYVHGHDTSKVVSLRFDLDLSSVDFLSEWPMEEYSLPIPGRPAGDRRDLSALGDDITNGRLTGQNHNQPIEPERNASMRRRPELQCFKKESEFVASFLFRKAENFEDARLDIAAVNSYRAAAV